MAKPEPYRLDPSIYPFRTEITPRFGDLDVNRHINNVAFARYFEEGRVRFQMERRGEIDFPAARGLLVSVGIEYLAEGGYPDPVTVCAGFGDIGRSSWHILLAAFQRDRCIATCDSVLAARTKDGPAELGEQWRALIEANQVKAP